MRNAETCQIYVSVLRLRFKMNNNKNWAGYMVSIQCKDNVGSYQGQIISASRARITLVKAFHNGVPQNNREVIINAEDIEDLKLIDSKPRKTGKSTVTVAKPVAKRIGRSISMSECTNTNVVNNIQGAQPKPLLNQLPVSVPVPVPLSLTVPVPVPLSLQVPVPVSVPVPIPLPLPLPVEIVNSTNDILFKNGTPNKKEKWTKGWRDEACFGTAMDQSMLQDFDFEKNLALFDKEGLWKKLNASQKPDVVRQTDGAKTKQKYRHDENVIATIPTAFRQIIVPAPDTREYVTDDGLIIPSITQELRRQLFAAAERRGLTLERQVELLGRAATEMALQLLGGGHRLNPHNTHQWPTVVVLCGPHRQGIVGLNCARQLASHGVNTVVYTALPDPDGALKTEFSLYKLTKNKLTTSVAGLPHTTDLIIVALCDDSDNPTSFSHVTEWTNQNRAPVLALDPPAVGTPGIMTKFSLVPVLPLSHSPDNGKLYLCNLGFPMKVFKDIAIKYRSPFGPKFVIALHPNDT